MLLTRLIALGGFAIAAVAYLLPFVTVSVGATAYKVAGVDLARAGVELLDQLPNGGAKYWDSFLFTFGPFTLTWLLAGIGFAVRIPNWRHGPAVALICGALGSALLVTGFLHWRQLLPWGFGIYLAMLGLFVATVGSAVGFAQVRMRPRDGPS